MLDHTIVRARDKTLSAHYLAHLLELQVGPATGPFLPVRTADGVTLDHLDIDSADPVVSQHYALGVPDGLFDRVLARLHDSGQTYWADPFHTRPGRTNTAHGGRGLYVLDPDGHDLELQTVPDGTTPPPPAAIRSHWTTSDQPPEGRNPPWACPGAGASTAPRPDDDSRREHTEPSAD